MVSEDAKKQNMARLQLSHIRGVFPNSVKGELRGELRGNLYRRIE